MKELERPEGQATNGPKPMFAKWAPIIVALLARAWRIDRQSLMRVLMLLCVTVAIVTNCVGFIGLSNGHYGGSVIGMGLAFVVSAASAVCFGRAITSRTRWSRLGWVGAWLFCASITVSAEYAFWFFQGSGEQLTSRTAREAAREAAIPLTEFASAYRSLSDQATSLKEYSAAKADKEVKTGFTCDPAIGAYPGPRQRLRDNDAVHFAQYARTFDLKNAELQRALGSLDSIYGTTGQAFYAAASSKIARAYATTVAAKRDPNLLAFRAYLKKRTAEGRTSIADPQTGEVFRCPDQELDSRMEAALAVQLSELPPMPPEITEPTLASAAARPFIIMTHPSRFQPDLDVRPLLLGLLVDLLPCIFVAALLQDGSTHDPKGPGNLESGHLAWLDEALNRRSALFSQLHRLREGYAGDESWLKFLDRYVITVPATRSSEFALDLLVVPSVEDVRAFGARSFALVLVGGSRAVLRYAAPFKELTPRWQEKLGPRWDPDTSFDVYQLEAGLLNELILAAANFATAQGGSFWSAACGAEQRFVYPSDEPQATSAGPS